MISWVADHRKHHAFSDQRGDPHSPHVEHGSGLRGALSGLVHAHVGWLFIHTAPRAQDALRPRPDRRPGRSTWVNDQFFLWVARRPRDPVLPRLAIGGTLLAGFTGMLWGGLVRMLVLHHVTYSINSLCHFFGRRTLRDRRRVAQPRLAGAAVVRRGLAQRATTRSRPRRATASAAGSSTRRRSSSPGWRRPGWRGTSCGSSPGADRRRKRGGRLSCRSASARRSARGDRARAPRPPVHDPLVGRRRRRRPRGDGGPTFSVRSPRAVGHVLRAPGQLGLGRAYVSGELDVDDIDAAIALLRDWQPPAIDGAAKRRLATAAAARQRPDRAAARAAARSCGRRASATRSPATARSVRHHYDVSNEFFALFLDESMTYCCAIFSRGATTLEEAQDAKRELVCTKLALQRGRARARRGLRLGRLGRSTRRRGTACTSPASRCREPQAARARAAAPPRRASPTASSSACMDWRELQAEPFDAIASIGMVEHVGAASIDAYARRLHRCCAPAGGCSTTASRACATATAEAGPFSERYVFPDAAPLHLSRVCLALEGAGLRARHRRGLPRGLRRDAAPLGAAAGRQPRRGRAPRRRRADARVAALPARVALGLRDRLHVDLPGPGPPARLTASALGIPPRAPAAVTDSAAATMA